MRKYGEGFFGKDGQAHSNPSFDKRKVKSRAKSKAARRARKKTR